MENIKINKLNTEIKPYNRVLEKIADICPSAIQDGKINFERLKEELATDIDENIKESYDFTWMGKRKAIVEANKPTDKTLRPAKEESKNWDTTENLYIEGDNLEVLKLIQESYLKSIKMIYIDPPYNTGKDFVYKDNFRKSKKEYENELGLEDKEGNKLVRNTDSNGRFHSDWCSMMYPRLKLAKDLLTDDGVIFISIDDNEVTNLRKICDEIFGVNNFYGTLIQLKGNTQNDSKSIQKNHEYILVYTKQKQPLLLTYNNDVLHEVFEDKFYLGRDTGASSGHDTLLERVNLGYTIYYYEGTESGATGNHNTLLERVNLASKKYPGFHYFISGNKIIHAIAIMDYNQDAITGDATENDVYKDDEELLSLGYKKIRPPKRKGGKLGRWTWSIENFKELWNNNEVLIKNEKNIIRKVFVKKEDIIEKSGKKYFTKSNNLPIQSIVKITNSAGTTILSGDKGLLPGIDFDNPKNPELLKFLLNSYSKLNENSIILDFFSGSATTAHAVMELNAEDGGNRKFIMVQLPEECEENSEAYKAGYKNICEIGKERIRRAGEKIKSENPDKTIDTGFRVLKLSESNMNMAKKSPVEFKQESLLDDVNNIKQGRKPLDLLYQVMIAWGAPLSLKIEEIKMENNTIYVVGDDDLVACFDEKISEATVAKMAEYKPLRVIFKDTCFKDDFAKSNMIEEFKEACGWDTKQALNNIKVL